MKVKNCKKIGKREIKYSEEASNVVVKSKAGSIVKRNMKLYVKRFLRFKQLAQYVKVSGDRKDEIKLTYINPVTE